MTFPRPLLIVLGSWAVGGCCTDAGCNGLLVIHLDRALSADAVVSVDLGDGTVDCIWTSDPVRVRVSEGGGEAVEHEVQVTASEPYSPNGKRCDPTCTGGQADLVL